MLLFIVITTVLGKSKYVYELGNYHFLQLSYLTRLLHKNKTLTDQEYGTSFCLLPALLVVLHRDVRYHQELSLESQQGTMNQFLQAVDQNPILSKLEIFLQLTP